MNLWNTYLRSLQRSSVALSNFLYVAHPEMVAEDEASAAALAQHERMVGLGKEVRDLGQRPLSTIDLAELESVLERYADLDAQTYASLVHVIDDLRRGREECDRDDALTRAGAGR